MANPDYLSTKFAKDFVAQASLPAGSYGIPAASLGAELGCSANPQAGSRRYVSVQHHLAHVFACMAENDIEPPLLGVAWDGTGYGLDGTVWGGEFFHITETSSNRVAHFRQFRLPGGDKAVKDPRRSAIGLLYEIFAEGVFEKTDLAPVSAFSESELAALKAMLKGNVNSPLTSSVGRLFDAVAALTGLRQQIRFEGQAAMELAGMFVIPTGTFTLGLKDAGTWRFHIDETMTFVRPTRMILPEDTKSWELSFNASNRNTYAEWVQKWISDNESKYAFRYLGALAGDFHRVLANGGMFMYPAIVNHLNPKKNRPEGKLRLMYEGAVVAFMCREAGGTAVNEAGIPILEIEPKKHHQRTALYVGSKKLVEDIARVLKAKG